MLSSRFGKSSPWLRTGHPLTDDQIRSVAPSIYAEDKHTSRSGRYSYIPTSRVLSKLRTEGFQPFMVCQTRVRDAGKRDHTKHMIRLRHADQISSAQANEIIMLNSHDGSSSYQMLAGCFRFVCQNGLVSGDALADVRIAHKGDIVEQVVQGAFDVLRGFEAQDAQREAMQSIVLTVGEAEVFGRAALSLKYDDAAKPAPVTELQVLEARRAEDKKPDLWSTLNRVQENLMKGGLVGRNSTGSRTTTRPIQGIDASIKVNRALWLLAEGMRELKLG